jgi:voltage-gated potassium channel
MDLKTRIYGILEPGDDDSKYFDPFIVGLIVLNIFAIILESVQSIREAYGSYLLLFEHFSVFVFTIEYILRLWSCNVVMSRLRYIKSPMAIVDLLAIIPFFLPWILPNITFLRVLRVFRILRILKLVRYSKSMFRRNLFIR